MADGMTTVQEEILAQLKQRGWLKADLAFVAGKSPNYVSALLSGRLKITAEVSRLLGACFATAPDYWMTLDWKHRLAMNPVDPEILQAIRNRAAAKERGEKLLTEKQKGIIEGLRMAEEIAEKLFADSGYHPFTREGAQRAAYAIRSEREKVEKEK